MAYQHGDLTYTKLTFLYTSQVSILKSSNPSKSATLMAGKLPSMVETLNSHMPCKSRHFSKFITYTYIFMLNYLSLHYKVQIIYNNFLIYCSSKHIICILAAHPYCRRKHRFSTYLHRILPKVGPHHTSNLLVILQLILCQCIFPCKFLQCC